MGQENINKVSLLSTAVWLSLDVKVRNRIAELFDLKKTGAPMVNQGPYGAVVVSDGYAASDFWPITVMKMNQILGKNETDFYKLFDMLLDFIDPHPVKKADEEVKEVETEEITNKPFCEFCDSKGGRHKLNCTRYEQKDKQEQGAASHGDEIEGGSGATEESGI